MGTPKDTEDSNSMKGDAIEATSHRSGTVDDPRRRRLMIVGGATWASVSLTGCTGIFDSANGDDSSGDDGEDDPSTYVFTDELITGSEGLPSGAGGFASACAPQRHFVPGMQAIFKVGVWDPETGDVLGGDDLDSVTVAVDRDVSVDLAYDDEEEYWSGNWVIPEDEETGTVSFTVEVTNGENFRRVGVLESEFEIIEFEDTRNYVVTSDLYTGSSALPEDNSFVAACGPLQRFAPGMMVGFDVGIYDGASGNPVGPTDFEYEDVVAGIESVTVSIPDYDATVDLAWSGGEGEHSELGEDLYWTGSWYVPGDAEPGTVSYTVEIESDADSVPVGAHASEFTIVES